MGRTGLQTARPADNIQPPDPCMEKFKVLDVSGDIGIEAHGTTVTEAFVNAAAGMYSLITNLEAVREKKTVTVTAESPSLDGLLVSWLNELIFHFDTYGFIGKRITVDEFTPSLALPPEGRGGEEACRIRATVSGEEFDPGRHEGKLLIKAATYHRLKVEKKDDRWEIDVIFDI
jgi:SHS2 domain-containing protein